jgi:hypothetical protein
MCQDKSKDSFIFYRSFKESLSELSDSDKLIVYEAISDYALDRIEPDLTGFPKALFSLIRPQLDANWKRFENGKKGAEYGKLGGAPIGNKNAKKNKAFYNRPQNNGKTTPNVNDNLNVNNIYIESSDSTNELSFENAWNLYQKKGNKKTSEQKWNKLSDSKKKFALANIPLYVESTPNKQFRKDFQVYLNQEVWNDELITYKQINQNEESANTSFKLHPSLRS